MNQWESSAGRAEQSDRVYEVVFTPVMERAEYQNNETGEALMRLKGLMPEADFDTYINNLLAVKYNGRQLWLITGSERHKTLLEGLYLTDLQEAFAVQSIRITSQV